MRRQPPWSAGLSNRDSRWLLVTGNRLVVAAVLLSSILFLLVLFMSVGVLSGRPSSPMYLLFSALLGGNSTLISVVLSINQLVLSRELGATGEFHSWLSILPDEPSHPNCILTALVRVPVVILK